VAFSAALANEAMDERQSWTSTTADINTQALGQSNEKQVKNETLKKRENKDDPDEVYI
jgi:hypothetical protein